MSFLGLTTHKELGAKLDAALKAREINYQSWLLQTAGAERFNLPDPSIYSNQADLYCRLSWVMAAVSAVAGDAALVELNVKRAWGERMRDIPNHPFETLIHKPNPLDSRYEFLYATVAMKKLTGNAYWWMNCENENLPPDELWLIPSHMIQPVPDDKMYLRGYLYYPGNGAEVMLEPWQVVHFRSFNPFSRFVGLSDIEALALVAQGDLGMQDWNTRLFKENNARLPGILTFEQMVEDGRWNKIKSDTREAARKRELLMLRGVGGGGVNWIQNAVSQKDMEFLAGRKANKEELWSVLAPGLAAMLDVTATEANAKAGRATFNERAIYPQLVMMQEKITLNILPRYGDSLYAEFDDIRYVDRQLELQEMDAYSKAHTYAEIREKYYTDKPLGDERDNMLPVQLAGKVNPMVPESELADVSTPEQTQSDTKEQPAMKADLKRWQRKAMKKVGQDVAFESELIPAMVAASIHSQLPTCKTESDVRSLFMNMLEGEPSALVVLEGIRLGVEALKVTNA